MTTNTTTVAAVSAGATTTVLGLTANEWNVLAVITGIVMTVATFAVNAFFQYRRDKREENGIKTSNKGRSSR